MATIMDIGRFFYWRAAGVFTVAVAVMAAWLLPGETVNAAPPTGPPQLANFIAPTGTTTTLTVSPTDYASPGQPVKLVATVTPVGPTAGVVSITDHFMDKDSYLYNGPPVQNTGPVSISTSRLAPGVHALQAHFLSYQPAAFTSSDSPPVILFVAPPTTTTLAVSPASPVRPGTPLGLVATVTPATAPGAVQFKDGTSNVGNAVPVNKGNALGFLLAVTPGTHQLIAVFTPTNPTAFQPSTSHPVTVTVR